MCQSELCKELSKSYRTDVLRERHTMIQSNVEALKMLEKKAEAQVSRTYTDWTRACDRLDAFKEAIVVIENGAQK